MIPVRLYQERPQSTMSGLNAPDGAGCFPTPRRVVRCPAWGNGPRIATGLRAPLGPGCTSLIEPGFAQFSQGSPPTDLPGLRATRMSTRPCGSGGPCCVLPIPARGRGPGGLGPSAAGRAEAGVVPGLGAPVVPSRRGDDDPAAGILVAGDGGGGPLLVALHAGQGGEHGDRVVDEASAGPGH